MYNKVILIGYVGKDAELRETTGGKRVAGFTLATSEKAKGEARTAWHTIVCWEKLAEIAGEYVKKGKLVMVEGRIEYGSYEKEGETHYKTEIVADTLKLLTKKEEE